MQPLVRRDIREVARSAAADHAENLGGHDTGSARRRRDVRQLVADLHAHRILQPRPVVPDLFGSHALPDRARCLGEAPGEVAGVEIAGALLTQATKDAGELRLDQLVAFHRQIRPVVQDDPPCLGIGVEIAGAHPDVPREGAADAVTESGVLLGGDQEALPTHAAEGRMQRRHSPWHAGDGCTCLRFSDREKHRLGALLQGIEDHAGSAAGKAGP